MKIIPLDMCIISFSEQMFPGTLEICACQRFFYSGSPHMMVDKPSGIGLIHWPVHEGILIGIISHIGPKSEIV